MPGEKPTWPAHLAVLCTCLGTIATLWVVFVRPGLEGAIRREAEAVYDNRAKVTDSYRDDQIREIRKTLERQTARIERIDQTISESLRSISASIQVLSKELRDK